MIDTNTKPAKTARNNAKFGKNTRNNAKFAKFATKFEDLTLDELKRGVELLVSPEELTERAVLTAILNALEFIPQDVLDQIKTGEPLNAGPVLCLDL